MFARRTHRVIGRRKRGFTLIELMISIPVIGILAAIAIPNFIKFQARSKQSEAKANLKAMFTAEKAYIQEKDKYSPYVGTIGFSPERNNRYAYYLQGKDPSVLDDRSGPIGVQDPNDTGISVDTFKYPGPSTYLDAFRCGVEPHVSASRVGVWEFLAGAMGNIDTDNTPDQWTIASYARVNPATCDADTSVPSGEPQNDQNDVNR
jgi:prepilin-type N-terminal cleavage/methylation domain-containing protein